MGFTDAIAPAPCKMGAMGSMGSTDSVAPAPSKKAPEDGGQLPPRLLSMAVEGLPPYDQSRYAPETEKLLKEYAGRYGGVSSLQAYCRAGLGFASYSYPGAVSLERLVVLSKYFAFAFLIDDLFFDNPDAQLLDQYGIDRVAYESNQKMQEYLDHLMTVFGQKLSPASPMETMMWEVGREIQALSDPEWFQKYIDCVVEYCHESVASNVDLDAGQSCLQSVKSYIAMRALNGGGSFVQMLMEFATDAYIPTAMRSDPYLKKVTSAATVYVAIVNDVFSYHKESTVEENPRNLVTVLMDAERKTFVQAAEDAIRIVNGYATDILDWESQAPNSNLQKHTQSVKELIAGNLYFNCMCERYRQPDQVFPELRDPNISWKAFVDSELVAT